MATICPTITAETEAEYELQLNNVKGFAHRVHIDIADATLAPRKLLSLDKLSWPKTIKADLHIMTQDPFHDVSLSLPLKPHLVIVHAEAKGDFLDIVGRLKLAGIKVGLALLQQTSVAAVQQALSQIDHVLVFSGNLGYQGGSFADLALLSKVKWLKQLKPSLEVGWDGGVNDINVASLIDGGVDVVNVGSFIQRSDNPEGAYAKLKSAIRK